MESGSREGRRNWLLGGGTAVSGVSLVIFVGILPSESPIKLVPWCLAGGALGVVVGYFGRKSVKDWRKPLVLIPLIIAFFAARHVVWSDDAPLALLVGVLSFFSLFFATVLGLGVHLLEEAR
jgi:predicted benzoate:H+ symporter BenE